MSPDPGKSEAFYTSLFGWGVNPMDMGDYGVYRMLRNGEKDFGGIAPLDSSNGVPSHWLSYIYTHNVDETTEQAKSLGATVASPPMDIPNVGRFSVVIDPEGAAFSPFTDTTGQPKPEGTTYADGATPGAVTWNELTAGNASAEASFYSQLFGYSIAHQDMGESEPYTILARGTSYEDFEAGVHSRPPDMPVSAWTIYFHVPDIDKALADVANLGGQALSPVIPVPGIGRVAVVADSVGAVFAIHQPGPMPA